MKAILLMAVSTLVVSLADIASAPTVTADAVFEIVDIVVIQTLLALAGF